MVKQNRFTQLVAALFVAALLLSTFGPAAADVSDPGGGPHPVAPGDSAATPQSTTPPDSTDVATDLYALAYLLLVVI